MKHILFIKLGLSLIVLNALEPTFVYADRDYRGDRRASKHSRNFNNPFRTKQIHKGFRLDNRYRHNQSYPRRGYTINRLPHRRPPIRYRNTDYYFNRGVWYRPYGSRFSVVVPPFGIVVPTLPPFYTTLWLGGIAYYYANNIYYTWQPNRNGYVVTEPPKDLTKQEPLLIPDELFIYPKSGQNEQRQADDRYACHSWSVSQTQYDPTQPSQNFSASDLNRKREDYQRAMRACLEGKNYSVR